MQNTSPGLTSFNASRFSVNFPMGVIDFANMESSRKKQILPVEGRNATSPFLNSILDLSIPESTLVSK